MKIFCMKMKYPTDMDLEIRNKRKGRKQAFDIYEDEGGDMRIHRYHRNIKCCAQQLSHEKKNTVVFCRSASYV